MLIYKILRESEWARASAEGEYRGSAVDLRDGYIHFSTAAQMRETAGKHFAGQQDLVLLAVDSEKLVGLKWEPSRGGDLFPHLYGVLCPESVVSVAALPLGPDGVHRFPEDGSST